MGADGVKSQKDAWTVYDRWLDDDRVQMAEEPADLETHFRALTRSAQVAPKDWADSYLAAFALASGLTIVTFDAALSKKAVDPLLLRS
jgi:uncharacterized protein